MDIADFLNARLDETEGAARDLARGYPGPWSADRSWVRDAAGDTVVHDEYRRRALPYIARHDPDATLREVATWRAILAAVPPVDLPEFRSGFNAALGFALQAKAREYSDHPDWRADGRWGRQE